MSHWSAWGWSARKSVQRKRVVKSLPLKRPVSEIRIHEGRIVVMVSSSRPLSGRPPLGGSYRDRSRKLAALAAICAIAGGCTPPPTEVAAPFDLTCTPYWVFENASSWQRANLPEQHYHVDLSSGLVNYLVPLSVRTPIQLAWTPEHGGYMYRITVNRLTGAVYEMQFNSAGIRTGRDMSGTCELMPPPPPQPKF